MIEQIEENVDLVRYVSNSIELEQRGNDYFGHCPLHVDKTPSFSITPSENKYYCFSCGYGGRIISYLCHYEKMSYDEAIQKAAQLGNTDLSKMCKSETMTYLKINLVALRKCVLPVPPIPDSFYTQKGGAFYG